MPDLYYKTVSGALVKTWSPEENPDVDGTVLTAEEYSAAYTAMVEAQTAEDLKLFDAEQKRATERFDVIAEALGDKVAAALVGERPKQTDRPKDNNGKGDG